MKSLCVSGKIDHCVPRYIELKYFSQLGCGSIRIPDRTENYLQVYMESKPGVISWVYLDKHKEIHKLVNDNLKEIMERYGGKAITYMVKRWYETNDMQNLHSLEFQNTLLRTEQTILNYS